ncbi:BREX system ATP-binding domain-containing protein [Archangium sp.]|uniref:BREX system ATP-binding domain-containing protein n=1 Tax=Archangium sp. TaxID=1872627 RepID=UPI00389A7261
MNLTEARRVIRALRSGVVSSESVTTTSVGTASIEDALASRLRAFASGLVGSNAIILEGDWGAGKSHLLMLCRTIASDLSIPWVHGTIDGRTHSLSHLHRCISGWLDAMRVGSCMGLRLVLESGAIPRESSLKWTNEHTGNFAQGLRDALNGHPMGWLRVLGHFYSSPDYSYQHAKAVDLFCSTAEFLRDLEKSGIVLMLDEVENIAREYDLRGRRRSYDTLNRFITHGSIFTILFVTQRFVAIARNDFERGVFDNWMNWPPGAVSFLNHLQGVERLRVPPLDEICAEELISKIQGLHRNAYGPGVPISSRRVIDAWRATPTRSTRLLIRMVIQELDLALGE